VRSAQAGEQKQIYQISVGTSKKPPLNKKKEGERDPDQKKTHKI
jgi:hypothetical protein